jgi:hypothetical protein
MSAAARARPVSSSARSLPSSHDVQREFGGQPRDERFQVVPVDEIGDVSADASDAEASRLLGGPACIRNLSSRVSSTSRRR